MLIIKLQVQCYIHQNDITIRTRVYIKIASSLAVHVASVHYIKRIAKTELK